MSKIAITRMSYPMLHQACQLIRLDSGGSHGHESYFIPGAKRDDLGWAESALFLLSCGSRDDFDTFCAGEASEQNEIADRRYGLGVAHRLLNEFFENGTDCCESEAA